jgi:hypothetical protein
MEKAHQNKLIENYNKIEERKKQQKAEEFA